MGMDTLRGLDPASFCQAFFLLGAAGVLAAAAAPSAGGRPLLSYGPRTAERNAVGANASGLRSHVDALAAALTAWGQVPHAWFSTFYLASLACSAFWGLQHLRDGEALAWFASVQAASRLPSMTLGQVYLAWALMVVQGLRRLFEQLVVVNASHSKMWAVHWALGMSFYLVVGVAVWIEGAQALLGHGRTFMGLEAWTKAVAGLPLFVLASVVQFRCHAYLAGLQKYSLPQGGLFRHIVCPHYTCECVLYLSLAVIAAPQGQLWNQSLLCAHIFVLINLGVTAYGTKKWYIGKFGEKDVARRWNMIPHVF